MSRSIILLLIEMKACMKVEILSSKALDAVLEEEKLDGLSPREYIIESHSSGLVRSYATDICVSKFTSPSINFLRTVFFKYE